MSDVEVYFNRPGQPWPKDQLISEIRQARDRVAIASAWFTDLPIAEALLASHEHPPLAPGNRVWIEGRLPARVLGRVAPGIVRVATRCEILALPDCLLEPEPR